MYFWTWPAHAAAMTATTALLSTPLLLTFWWALGRPGLRPWADHFVAGGTAGYLLLAFAPLMLAGPPETVRSAAFIWLQFPPWLVLFGVRLRPAAFTAPAYPAVLLVTSAAVGGEPGVTLVGGVVMVGVVAVCLVGLYQLERSRRRAFAFGRALTQERDAAGVSMWLPQTGKS